MTADIKTYLLKYKSIIFMVLIVFLMARVIIPQLDGLRESISALQDANLWWVLIGTIVFFLGVPVLALQFMALALHPIRFWLTYKVEMAGLFVSKLLPSSLGTISLNMYYFIKHGHTPSQATTVVAMNGITSGIAYGFLILLALASSSLSLRGLTDAVTIPSNLYLFIVILILGLLSMLYRSAALRSRLALAWADLRQNFTVYRERPRDLFYGLVCNFTGSFTSLFALYASAHAIGVDLSLAGALLAYTFGNIAAALVPTPGGVGATEAGIYSGLVLVGVPGPEAILITLLYRLITYWVPIIPGYYFFWDLRKTLLSGFSVNARYH